MLMVLFFSLKKRTTIASFMFVLPAIALLLLIFVYPMGRAFWLSVFTQNLETTLMPVFSGWTNLVRMSGDSRFGRSLINTLVFTAISIVIELGVGLGMALILNQRFLGRGLTRTIALLPWALPTAIMGLAWGWMFNDQFGFINDLLLRFGVISQGLNWLGNPRLAMLAVIIADVWKTTPFMAIILLAGLQAIPRDLYEAHGLDGANLWQDFRQITLPLIMPQLLIALLFRFAQAFGIFDLIQVMTGGGPAGATETVSIYIYATVMRYLDFGYGAVLVVATFMVLLGIVVLTLWVIRRVRLAEGL